MDRQKNGLFKPGKLFLAYEEGFHFKELEFQNEQFLVVSL